MSTPARRESRTLVPDLFDLLEMPFTAMRPLTGQAIRIEDCVQDDQYIIRAELPGIDPDKDVEISVSRGVLTVRAERHEEHERRHHSEFRYGSYERHIRLPENVREEEIKASYDNGILTVRMPFEEAKESTRRVPVEH
jgi:HSP20 family molecular chaperone IbpA